MDDKKYAILAISEFKMVFAAPERSRVLSYLFQAIKSTGGPDVEYDQYVTLVC